MKDAHLNDPIKTNVLLENRKSSSSSKGGDDIYLPSTLMPQIS